MSAARDGRAMDLSLPLGHLARSRSRFRCRPRHSGTRVTRRSGRGRDRCRTRRSTAESGPGRRLGGPARRRPDDRWLGTVTDGTRADGTRATRGCREMPVVAGHECVGRPQTSDEARRAGSRAAQAHTVTSKGGRQPAARWCDRRLLRRFALSESGLKGGHGRVHIRWRFSLDSGHGPHTGREAHLGDSR